MNITAIASRVQLVTLSQQAWRPVKLNRAETRKVNDTHGTGNKAAVRVKICDHPALGKIASLQARVYADHIRITRPSIQDGMRLLPAGKAFEHAEMIRLARVEHDALVAEFLRDYDTERAAAPAALNGLYDPSAWPDAQAITRKFGIECRYLPCPTDGTWADWLSESATAATAELRDQLEAAVKRVQERCASDGRLYKTVFTGLRELLEGIPDLDITDNSEIRRLAELAKPLAAFNAEDISDNDATRKAVAAQAANIIATFSAFGAGSLADV